MARKVVSQDALIAGAVQADHFGVWLRERLAERGLSPAEFARRTGKAPQQMSRWFRQGAEVPERASLLLITSTLAIAPLAPRKRTPAPEVTDVVPA